MFLKVFGTLPISSHGQRQISSEKSITFDAEMPEIMRGKVRSSLYVYVSDCQKSTHKNNRWLKS